MRYASLNKTDLVNGEGISVSLFVQGCPIQCHGCHNSELWDKDNGKKFTQETMNEIIKELTESPIKKNFSLLGGEPLAQYNAMESYNILKSIKEKDKNIKTYVWTGYEMDELRARFDVDIWLQYIDVLIVGRFDIDQRDITLPLCGSRNQKVLRKEINY